MPLLNVHELKVYYPVRGALPFARRSFVRAVDDVSFAVAPGEIVGLVGESGCGKSTLGRALVRLETPTAGTIELGGVDLARLRGGELRRERKNFQMIFQDPYGALNPRMTAGDAVEEVLALHSAMSRSERRKRTEALFAMVGLQESHLDRYPHQFSGGQRQRIGIARALAAEPRFIVADEPVSALDVSVQAQIINLLSELRKSTGVAILFIAHDLGVVEHISDRILVMYLGKIVESGPAHEVCSSPQHPYTRSLLSAVPRLDRKPSEKRMVLTGDVPSPLNPPSGCAFHPRCPWVRKRCRTELPELTELPGGEHACRCFFPGKGV